MVRIPDRPYAYLARNIPQARVDAEGAARAAAGGWGAAGDLTRGLAAGAGKIFDLAMKMREQRDHDLLLEAQNRYTGGMSAFSLEAEQTRIGETAAGLTRDYAAASDRTHAEVEQWMKERGGTDRARNYFASWAGQRKTSGGVQAAQFEHGQLKAHSGDVFAARVRGLSEQVEHNPLSFADAAGQLEQTFALGAGQGLFRPQEAKNKFLEAKKKLGAAAFESLYARNRGQALGAMNDFGLSEPEQAAAKKRFTADARADAALARAETSHKKELLLAGLNDAETLAELGGDMGNMEKIGAELAALGDRRGPAILEKAALLRLNAATARQSRELPLGDLYNEIEKLEESISLTPVAADSPAGAAAGAPDRRRQNRVLPEDAAEGVRLSSGAAPASEDAAEGVRLSELARELRGKNMALDISRKIFAARAAELKKDPAGAVAARAGKAAGPDASPAVLADAALRAQAADGLPEPLRRILPNAESARLGALWRSGGATEKLGVFSQIQEGYGRHAGRVFGEMGLNPLEESLARSALAANTPEAAAAFLQVSAAAGAGEAELPKPPEGSTKAAELAADSVRLKAMRDCLELVMPGNAALAGKIRAAEDAAAKLLRLNGGNLDAAKAALDAGAGSLKTDGAVLMFESGRLDGDELEDALEAARDRLDDFDEFLPGYGSGEKKERIRYLKRKGIWSNAPDGDGFALFDPRGQTPVLDKKGGLFRVREGDVPGLLQGGDYE